MTPNVLHLVGEVNESMYSLVSKKLYELEALPEPQKLLINLCSEGGHAYDGLAICGRMRSSSVTILVDAFGKVMSAATIILAAGDYRTMSREGWIMLHDSTDRLKGQLTELNARVRQLDSEEQQWANLLELHTGTPEETWRKLSKKTSYLTAAQAYQLGLIDAINKGKSRT